LAELVVDASLDVSNIVDGPPVVSLSSQMKTSRTFIRDATAASPLALALFGAGALDVAHEGGYVALGGWLRFRAPAQVSQKC
jgi:hypothetical protein